MQLQLGNDIPILYRNKSELFTIKELSDSIEIYFNKDLQMDEKLEWLNTKIIFSFKDILRAEVNFLGNTFRCYPLAELILYTKHSRSFKSGELLCKIKFLLGDRVCTPHLIELSKEAIL